MELISALRFKQVARFERHKLEAPIGVLKACSCQGPPEEVDERTLRFVVSTDAVDREMDRIDQAGWKLDHYKRNPVVLWSHRPDTLPIGRTVALENRHDQLKATIEFIPAEGYGWASRRADEIYRLAKDGYLQATSVGFRPIKFAFSEDKERGADSWFGGIDYHETELVELSLVTVPANPDALLEVGAGYENNPAELAAGARAAAVKRRRQLALIHARG